MFQQDSTNPHAKDTSPFPTSLFPTATAPGGKSGPMGLSPRERRRFFDQLVEEMKHLHHLTVRKWRRRMSGVAYELHYSNGDVRRMIAAPRPRSPVSCSIFLHEVGHHAIGFRKFRPRCLEEYEVWQWTFGQMRRHGIPIDWRVQRHYRRSLYHYVRKACRRGIKHLPPVLEEFRSWPG